MELSFEDMGLSRETLRAVSTMGFEAPSPIQALAIPVLLEGKDIIAQAQTGTGKTAAFGIPALEGLDARKRKVQVLVLCPTRELAVQVAEEISTLGAFRKNLAVLAVYGGQPIERQLRALERGVQIVVGTPGRIMDHMQRRSLDLSGAQLVVLDEADEMLNMGFREDMEAILQDVPNEAQKALFSATMPAPIKKLAETYLQEPEHLRVEQKTLTVPGIEQTYYEVRYYQKMEALCRLLDAQDFRKALIFCATKRAVDEMIVHLQSRGYQADGLHGDLAQGQRDRVMKRFRSGELEILIATDVAARGLDVDDVDAVINYDIPYDSESYVHRVGRTGRAGRTGKAFTLVCGQDYYKLRDIMRNTKAKITEGRLPSLREVADLKTGRVLDEIRTTLDSGEALDRYLDLVGSFLNEDRTSLDMAAALLKLLMQRDFGEFDESAGDDLLQENRRDRPQSGERGRFSGKGARYEFERGSGSRQGFERSGAGRFERSDKFERPGKFEKFGAPGKFKRGGKDRDFKSDRDKYMARLFLSAGKNAGLTPQDIVGAIANEAGVSGRMVGSIELHERFSFVDVHEQIAEQVIDAINQAQIRGLRLNMERAVPVSAGNKGKK